MLIDRPMYAYEISKGLKNRFGFSTAIVTTYVVLYKLQREGLIEVEEEAQAIGRPKRKYYTITKRGKQEFEKACLLLQTTFQLLK
jgi:PadR family transcriptional regulator PadR